MSSTNTQAPSSLQEWCLKHMAIEDLTFDVIDLERLFKLRCTQFLKSRTEHGFSESTYRPERAPSLTIAADSDFGACAYIEGGTHTVVVNGGTLSFLLWASMKCVMAPAFPMAGPEELLPTAKRRSGRNSISLGTFDIPILPARRALGIELAFLCFLFIVFHEVGHLAQGHCSLITAGFRDYGSAGGSNEEKAEIGDDLRRCALEFMADQFATRELLIYLRSVRDEVFPGGAKGGHLSPQGDAYWFCYADPIFAPLVPYALLAIIFHFTSSASPRHPTADLRLLASLRASHQLVPTLLEAARSREMFELGVTLQQIVDDTLIAAAPEGQSGWRGLSSLQPGRIDQVESELDQLHAVRRELEPLLRPHVQGPKALLRYEDPAVAQGR